ncbi:cofactor-independent phosphoglycerate mutase [Chitinispirillales bacterium ANBcel5]|uniref:cofactor-independent phosphoglycerate mutase n=1 Tax=Cellulosispirillum alkaliphilum TaxID=3039283 RepID=UPI002A569A20|nr:cofactor-independent phosphoglycerate mutase [Chitinispirillales bacterium ANBcel5]
MMSSKSKYAILVGDGMADFPIAALDNKTPLEWARTPNMDKVVESGRTGLAATVPEGLPPGSDVANMSLMGYDPLKYYCGRAPIEAASMGVELGEGDIAFRCNLVTLRQGIMEDYSAGHIDNDDATELITLLEKELGNKNVKFYPGISYRHLVVLKGIKADLNCTPPHDISGRLFADALPRGQGSEEVKGLMQRASQILSDAAINKRRKESGKLPATDIWLWGQGPSIKLPDLKERFGLSGSVISAVDLVRGLGKLTGLNVRIVEGATGYLGTNYAGKVSAARDALMNEDFVYLHVEAPDETSHEGSLEKKILAIEEFDQFLVGEMIKIQEQIKNLRILVMPDHATPVSLKTHHAAPVPFGVSGAGIKRDAALAYNEKAASGYEPISGPSLFEAFIKGTL